MQCPWHGCKNKVQWVYSDMGVKGLMCMKHWAILIEYLRRKG